MLNKKSYSGYLKFPFYTFFHLNLVVLVVFLLSYLVGCTTTKVHEKAPAEHLAPVVKENRINQLVQMRNWHLSGKIALQTPRESGSAILNWQQNQDRYRIALSGPLGASAMTLVGRPGLVVLTNDKGERFSANSPEALLAKRWGYQLPVSYLQYWIKGIPVPKLATSHESLRNGYYQSFMQQGWQVNIQEYAQFSGIELPKRITISSAALRSKMVIYNWQRG